MKIADRSPYGDAFASSIACSSDSMATTGATGPNVSSVATSESGLTPSMIVGCQYRSVGYPDARYGERVCAFVVPRTPEPTAPELRRFLRERGLAAFKIPDRVRIVPDFPHTGVGKVSKSELRRAIAEHEFGAVTRGLT